MRATVGRNYSANITKEQDFWVQNIQKVCCIPHLETPVPCGAHVWWLQTPEINTTIKMEVGIEDCLHIEFEYNQAKCVTTAAPRVVPSSMSIRMRDVIAMPATDTTSRTW